MFETRQLAEQLLLALLILTSVDLSLCQSGQQDLSDILPRLLHNADTKTPLQFFHKVTKRSVDNGEGIQPDDLILSSIASYCHQVISDPFISKRLEKMAEHQPLSTQNMRGYHRYTSLPAESTHVWNYDAFPVKLLTGREDENIWVVFYVAHSQKVSVSRLHFQDFEEVVLEFPESACQTIVSKARFAIPSPNCSANSPNKRILEVFRFGVPTSSDSVHVYVDLCNTLEETESAIVSKTLAKPAFVIEQQSTSINAHGRNIVLPGENDNDTRIEVTVVTPNVKSLQVDLILYDWQNKDIIQRTVTISHSVSYRDIVEIRYNNDQPIQDENADEYLTVIRDVDYDCIPPFKGWNDCMRLGISIKTQPDRNISGRVSFRQVPIHSYYYYKPISYDTPGADVHLPLVRPEHPGVSLPSDLTYFSGKTRFLCRDEINSAYENSPFPGKCLLKCLAYGPDISFIYIAKQIPSKNMDGFISGSYVLPHMAEAVLGVERSDDDVEGDYTCTIINKRGETRTQQLKLYTGSFTEINSFQLGGRGELKAIATCDVSGEQSVKISISGFDGYGQKKVQFALDDDSVYSTTRDVTETGIKISVVIPWKDLRHPLKILRCEAVGDRGADERDVALFF